MPSQFGGIPVETEESTSQFGGVPWSEEQQARHDQLSSDIEKSAADAESYNRQANIFRGFELGARALDVPSAVKNGIPAVLGEVGNVLNRVGERAADVVSSVGRGEGVSGALDAIAGTPPERPPMQGILGAAEKGVRGLAKMVPVIAASGAIPVPMPLSFGMLSGSQALAEGASVPEAVQQGIIGAAMPMAIGLGKEAAATALNKLVQKGLLSANANLVQKAVEMAAAQGTMQLFTAGIDLPAYAAATPEDRKKMVVENVIQNAAWVVPDALALRPSVPSQTQSEISDLSRASSAMLALAKHEPAINEIKRSVDDFIVTRGIQGSGTETRNVPIQADVRVRPTQPYVAPEGPGSPTSELPESVDFQLKTRYGYSDEQLAALNNNTKRQLLIAARNAPIVSIGGGLQRPQEGAAANEPETPTSPVAQGVSNTGAVGEKSVLPTPGSPADTVRQLVIQAQKDAGWNPKWPFIPADFGNRTFREALELDPTLSNAEKDQMFSAAGKLLGGKIERSKKPDFEYSSPESKAWWEKLDELERQQEEAKGTDKFRAARQAISDHEDLAYGEGGDRTLARRRIDKNNPLEMVNATQSQFHTMGQINLTGWKFSGDWFDTDRGVQARTVIGPDGTKLTVWRDTLHPLEESQLEKNTAATAAQPEAQAPGAPSGEVTPPSVAPAPFVFQPPTPGIPDAPQVRQEPPSAGGEPPRISPRPNVPENAPEVREVQSGQTGGGDSAQPVPEGQAPNAPAAPFVRVAPAKFGGLQEGFGAMPPVELWNLTEEIPGHSKGSTVSRKTLEDLGFQVPEAPVAPPPAPPGPDLFGSPPVQPPPRPESPPLHLDKPESIEDQKARLAKEKEVRDQKAAKESAKARAAAPLKGTAGDLGQGDLLGGGPPDLFAPPPPQAVEAPPQKATSVTPPSVEPAPNLTPAESARLSELTHKEESGKPLTTAEARRYRELRDKATGAKPVQEEGVQAGPSAASFPADLARRLLALPHEQQTDAYGPANEELRRDIIEALTGTRPPKSKAGAKATGAAIAKHFGIDPGHMSGADVDQAVRAKLREADGQGPRELSVGNPFYSRLTRTVEQSTTGKATGAQWKATIRNSKLGANADEMGLVGVGDLEDGKVYTKQEVLDYLKANEVKVVEVTLGGEKDKISSLKQQLDAKRGDLRVLTQQHMRRDRVVSDEEFNKLHDEIRELEDELRGIPDNETHFSQYTLPGAKEGSYREVLLTVPPSKGLPHGYRVIRREDASFAAQHPDGRTSGWYFSESEAQKYADELNQSWPEALSKAHADWHDGHQQYSDIPNPIVRLRFNERTTSDGKRMLFLEELQPPQKDNFSAMPALFQKNWREIGFKWALRYAAENGYDSLGWTSGDMQAERYDLSKQVDGIATTRKSDGTYRVEAFKGPRGERHVLIDQVVPKEGLEGLIGKDLAAKAIASSDGFNEWIGENLKVGGEGLRKLYDQDFRNVVNGLPAVKKSGQKVGQDRVGGGRYSVSENLDGGFDVQDNNKDTAGTESVVRHFDKENEASTYADALNAQGEAVHAISITPEIRDSVMQGQPMFTQGKGQRAVVMGNDIPLDTPADIRRVIDDPKSNVSPEHRTMLRFMLDKGLMDQFPGLRAEVTDFIRGGAMGEYTGGPGQSGFIRFVRWSEASTPFHELMHHVWRFLSPEDRAAIGAMRRKMLLSEAPSEHRGDLLKGISSDEFVKRQQADGSALGRDHYHLANDSEFFAWLMSNKAEKAITTPEAKGIIGKVTNLLRVLRDAFKDAFGLSAKEDALWRKIIGGKYSYRTADSIEFSRKTRELSLTQSPEEFAKKRERERLGYSEGAFAAGTRAAYATRAEVERRSATRLGIFGPDVLNKLRLPLTEEMAEISGQAVGPHNYQQLRDGAGTQGERASIIRDAYEAAVRYQFLGHTLRSELADAMKEISSPEFRRKLGRMNIKKEKAEILQDAKRTFINQAATSGGRILKQLQSLRDTGAMSDQLREDYASVSRLPQVSEAVESRFNDIVDVLTQTYPTSIAGSSVSHAVNDPGRNRNISLLLQGGPAAAHEIYQEYIDALPYDRRQQLTGDQAAYARLACEVLAHNAELRNAYASLMEVQHGLIGATEFNEAGSRIAQSLMKNPEAGVRRVASTAAGLSAKAARAEAAWLAINRAVGKDIKRANDLSMAVEVHKATMEDPEYVDHQNMVYSDRGAKPLPDELIGKINPDKFFFEYSDKHEFDSPSGQRFEIDFGATPATVQESMQKLADLNREVSDWLSNNPNHPSRTYWNERQNIIEATLMSQAVWNPVCVQFASGKIPGMKRWMAKHSAFGMPEAFFQGVKLPAAKMAWFAQKTMDRLWTMANGWVGDYSEPCERALQQAYKAHGYRDGGRQRYRTNVFNHIAWAFRNGIEVRVGDVIAGRTITKEDTALLRAEGAAYADLYKRSQKAREVYGSQDVMEAPRALNEFTGGAWGMAKPMELGIQKGTTLAHKLSQHGEKLASRVHGIQAAHDKAMAALPTQSPGSTQAQMTQARQQADQARLRGHLDILANDDVYRNAFMKSFIRERNTTIFPELSPYEQAYAHIRDMDSRGQMPATIDEAINELVAQTGEPIDQVRDTLLKEWAAMNDRVYKMWEAKEKVKSASVRPTEDLDTAFSRAYSGDIAGSYYYDYGFVNQVEMRSYANDMGAFGLKRLNMAFASLESQIENAINDLTATTEGTPERRAFLKKNKTEYELSQTFRDYQTLEGRLVELRKIKEGMQVWNDPLAVHRGQFGLGIFGRLLNDLISAAITGQRTAGRISGTLLGGSAWKMGLVFQQLGKNMLTSVPEAALQAVCTVGKLGTGTVFGWYIPGTGYVHGIPGQLVKNVPGAVRAFREQRGGERVWSAMEAALKGVTDQQWSLMRWWYAQKALGMMPDKPLGTRMANMFGAARSQGGKYATPEQYPETIFGKAWMRAGDVAYQLLAVPEAVIQAAGTYFPNGWGYNVNYETVAAGAAKYIDALATHSRRTFETYEKLGQLSRFNLVDLRDPANDLKPWDVLPTHGNVLGSAPEKLWAFQRPNEHNLTFARDLFSSSTDVDLNDLVLRYWQRLARTPRDQRGAVEFLAPEETDPTAAEQRSANRLRGLASRFVEQTHHAVPSNRAWWQHKNPYLQVIQPYLGWTSQTLKLIDTYLGGAQTSKFDSKVALVIAGGMAALAAAAWATIGGDTETRILRLWDRYVNHKEVTIKTIDEAEGPKETAEVLIHDMTSVIPFVNNISNALLGESYRGQTGAQAFGFDKLNAFLGYAKGVMKTHDPTYGLPALVEANFPFSEPFIENLFSRQGFQTSRNAVRSLQKFGPQDLVEKRQSFGGIAVPTELSPYKNALNEAIFSGNSDLVAKASKAFTDKATELGRTDASKLLGQIFGSMNPDRKAFGVLPTAQQHAEAMSKMGDWERSQVQKAETNYAAAAAQLGLSANFIQEDTARGSVGGALASGVGSSRSGESPAIGRSGSASAVSGFGGGTARARLSVGSPTGRRVSLGRSRISTGRRARLRVGGGRSGAGHRRSFGVGLPSVAKRHRLKVHA